MITTYNQKGNFDLPLPRVTFPSTKSTVRVCSKTFSVFMQRVLTNDLQYLLLLVTHMKKKLMNLL